MTTSYRPNSPNSFSGATTIPVPTNRYVERVEPLGIPGVARHLSATASSQNTALTTTTSRISMRARGADIRFQVGVGAQTANASTSHFIGNGERLDFAVPLNANIAVIRDTAAASDGTLSISELV